MISEICWAISLCLLLAVLELLFWPKFPITEGSFSPLQTAC